MAGGREPITHRLGRAAPSRAWTASLGLATLLLPAAAAAQVASAPTREEINRGRLDEQLRTEGQAVAVEEGVERAPCPLANPQFADLRFTLQRAEFSGLDRLEPGLVDPAWRDLVGQELPVAAVCEIRDRAATILRRAGYLAAVQVPAQQIEDGTVRFDVLLARIADVQVRGDAGGSEKVLRRYIAKLTGQPVLNVNEAERYLLLARDIPGLDVRLSLQQMAPGEGQLGDVVGVFNVTRTPFAADLNIQNFGSKAVGRFGGLARLRAYGLTGLADETSLSLFATADFDEQLVASAQHAFKIGGEGLTLGGAFTYAWTKPDIGFRLKSDTIVASAYAAYPFVRSQDANLFGTFGLEYLDQTVDTLGTRTNEDTLAVLFARGDFNLVDPESILGRGGYSPFEPRYGMSGSLEVRQGLDILGASEGCGPAFVRCQPPVTVIPTRADGDPTAFVVRGQAELDWRPAPLFKLALKPRFQWSPDALFAYEEISGGNYTAGRGYDPGIIIGDSGYGLQGEIAYGSLVPKSPEAIAFQPFAFLDMMAVWNKNVPFDPDKIYSAGGGFRATIGRHASIDSYLAVPLQRSPFAPRRGDVRALISLTVQLLPWN
jgi:hemolysin activation/secretion protein